VLESGFVYIHVQKKVLYFGLTWPLGAPLVLRLTAKTDPVSETLLLFYRSHEICKHAPNRFNSIRAEFMPFLKFHTHTKHLQVYCCMCLYPPQIRTNTSRDEWASWELILYVILSQIEFLFVSFFSSSQWTLCMFNRVVHVFITFRLSIRLCCPNFIFKSP